MNAAALPTRRGSFSSAIRSGNGALLVDVPNRGHVYAQALYNSPREAPFGDFQFKPSLLGS